MVFVPDLRAWRKYRVLTQQQLAERAGVDTSTVLNAEKGRKLRISTVQSLARALGTTPRRLLQPPPADK